MDVSGKVAVIHNGIIENFAALRKELESAGVELQSETDTEVVAHLLSMTYDSGPTRRRSAGQHGGGLSAIAGRIHPGRGARRRPEMLVAARRNSPLVVGIGDGEMFVASDVSAFIEHTATRSSSVRTSWSS